MKVKTFIPLAVFAVFLPLFLFGLFGVGAGAAAKIIETNAAHMAHAPEWLTRNRAEKPIDRMQVALEWTIRKIQVHWYTDEASFSKAHSLGSGAIAVARSHDNTIHLGPKVNSANFDQVFAHELVHIIIYQKYKDAIPKWLEEGLANHLAKYGKVDYRWLNQQELPQDVQNLTHPFNKSPAGTHLHYVASQALAEMIARKCDLTNLLRLSVERKLENYLKTYCEIPDLNTTFRAWVKSKAGTRAPKEAALPAASLRLSGQI
ncbi:MAG: hypothetical protein AB7G93_19145 [Bdellovibrionales bacterium]